MPVVAQSIDFPQFNSVCICLNFKQSVGPLINCVTSTCEPAGEWGSVFPDGGAQGHGEKVWLNLLTVNVLHLHGKFHSCMVLWWRTSAPTWIWPGVLQSFRVLIEGSNRGGNYRKVAAFPARMFYSCGVNLKAPSIPST